MRLDDDAYYEDRPVTHTAQGDLYDRVPFAYATVPAVGDRPRGARKRPTDDLPVATVAPLETTGVVCSYTCGFLAQPPGTEGYAHPFRTVAPILPLRDLLRMGMKANELRKIREYGGVNGFMYLPVLGDDEEDDEWRGAGAALLYRPTLVSQGLLDQRERVARLSEPAQRILIARLIQIFSPSLFDPSEPVLAPDMSDSWAPR